MRERRRKFTPEFKDEAVKMVIESSRPVAEVARGIQVNEGTLGKLGAQVPGRPRRRGTTAVDLGALPATRARTRSARAEDEGRVPGKSSGLLRPGVSVSAKFAFIDAEKAPYSIVKMCAWMGVSTSGFYEWRDRPASATARRRDRLATLIEWIFNDSDQTYGHRRIHAALLRQGERLTPELVRAIMRELGLIPCQPRPFRPTTTVGGDAGPVPDLVARDFHADAPGSKLVGDITYLPTWEGWLYLATVIDCHTKACIGYALAEDAIFHSDRGTQYSSRSFAEAAAALSVRRSVGRTGSCFDNALAESFNASLKVERVHRTVVTTIIAIRKTRGRPR